MEVKTGYKQTAVGLVPDDWEVVSIGSLASFSAGSGIKVKSLHAESTETPFPVYGGNGISGYTHTALVNEPTVVVGRVGQKCGEVYLSSGPAWITDNALYPRAFYRDVDIHFFALSLCGAGLNNLKNRNDLPLITQGILHSVLIAWPPCMEEQRAIAAVLKNVDALLSGLDRLIAKKRDLKQAAMQQLLTGQTRLPGFSGEWEIRRLRELGTFLKGSGVRKDEAKSGDLPCVRYGEIYTHHNDFIRSFNSWISRGVAATATPLRPVVPAPGYGAVFPSCPVPMHRCIELRLRYGTTGEVRCQVSLCRFYAARVTSRCGSPWMAQHPPGQL
jgi:type I restriction enzyme, S subunit